MSTIEPFVGPGPSDGAGRPRQEDAAHSRAAALERGAPAARLARPADAGARRPPRSDSRLPRGDGHLRPDRARTTSVSSQLELLIFCLSLPAWVVVAKLYGLYDFDEERTDHSTADDLVGVLHLVTVGSWLFFAFAAVTQRADPGFARLLGFWLFAIAAITVGRAIARGVARRHLAYVQNTIIVGAGDVGQLVAKKLRQHPEYGLNLVGFVDDQPKERISGLSDIALLGGLGQLPQMVQILDVERVIVAFSNDSHEEMLDLIRDLKDLDIQIDLVPRFFEVIGTNVGIHTAEGLPLIGLPALRLSRSSKALKRTMDLALSITGLVLLAPLFAAVAVWIKLDSRGPVFFRQLRMGAERADLRDLQVPHHGPGCGRPQARVRRAEQAQRQRRRPSHVQDPQRPARDPLG